MLRVNQQTLQDRAIGTVEHCDRDIDLGKLFAGMLEEVILRVFVNGVGANGAFEYQLK